MLKRFGADPECGRFVLLSRWPYGLKRSDVVHVEQRCGVTTVQFLEQELLRPEKNYWSRGYPQAKLIKSRGPGFRQFEDLRLFRIRGDTHHDLTAARIYHRFRGERTHVDALGQIAAEACAYLNRFARPSEA